MVLTRRRAAVVITLACAGALLSVKFFLRYIEFVHGYDDARDEEMTLMFGMIVGVLYLKSLIAIFHRPRTLDA